MKLPEARTVGPVIILSWEAGVQARISRIRQHDETVTAEVKVTSTLPGQPTHLAEGRLNLVSLPTRKQWASNLNERLPGDGISLDWLSLMEQLCVLALRHIRQGEPVIDVSLLPERERLVYRLNPILLEKQPNLIFGDGGSGKTTLAVLCAVLIGGPVPAAISHLSLEPEAGRVLILDWETEAYEIRERVRMLLRGMDQPEEKSNIFYRFCAQPLTAEIEEIQTMVGEHEIDVVIVDSVGAACGGEPESADVTLAYFRALRALQCTTLSIDHVTKAGIGREKRTAFGSVYKMNAARNAFELRRSQEEDSEELHLGLFHRKCNTGRLLKPMGFRFTFGPTAYKVEREDAREIPDFKESLSQKDRIALALRRGALTVAEIAEELSLPPNAVRTYLTTRLTGQVIKVGDRWGLVKLPDEAQQ